MNIKNNIIFIFIYLHTDIQILITASTIILMKCL